MRARWMFHVTSRPASASCHQRLGQRLLPLVEPRFHLLKQSEALGLQAFALDQVIFQVIKDLPVIVQMNELPAS